MIRRRETATEPKGLNTTTPFARSGPLRSDSTVWRDRSIGRARHLVGRSPHMVDRAVCAGQSRAIRATIKRVAYLDPMPDHLAPAVRADRRELVDRTLEAVEHVSLAGGDDLER